MQITYIIVVALITYILGAFTKIKWDRIPNKYIPIQNVIIALISSFICYFTKLEPNFLNSLILCFMATMGAGGTSSLIKLLKNNDSNEN